MYFYTSSAMDICKIYLRILLFLLIFWQKNDLDLDLEIDLDHCL